MKDCGCNDVIYKPFIRDEFYRMLSRFFGPFAMGDPHSDAKEMESVTLRFAAALPARAHELEEAHRRGDFAEISRIAHKLAAAAMFGFRALSELALELERVARAEEPEQIAVLVRSTLLICQEISMTSGAGTAWDPSL